MPSQTSTTYTFRYSVQRSAHKELFATGQWGRNLDFCVGREDGGVGEDWEVVGGVWSWSVRFFIWRAVRSTGGGGVIVYDNDDGVDKGNRGCGMPKKRKVESDDDDTSKWKK